MPFSKCRVFIYSLNKRDMEELVGNPLFKGIHPKKIEEIFSKVFYQEKVYEIEEIIAHSDDDCENLLIVMEGIVRGEMIDFSGKTIKIEDIPAPNPVATAFLFGQRRKLPVNIVANTKVRMMRIPRDSVIKMFQMNSYFLENYLNMISSRAQFLSMKIKFLSFKTIKGKIAQLLLDSLGSGGDTIILNRSQQSLADLFGVARPSLARAMGEMVRDKLIRVERKEVKVLNRKGLNQLMQA
ncbi:MAG: Crp/Fnr family transcriptional regulator [Bacteroidales bacterium]|nr:Crp/Fnr family transcriptional regulator [Bacteroidales bacterium]